MPRLLRYRSAALGLAPLGQSFQTEHKRGQLSHASVACASLEQSFQRHHNAGRRDMLRAPSLAGTHTDVNGR
jgi:hypothetical protein